MAECASGRQALAIVPGCRPDIILMDIQLPDVSGIECVRQLSPLLPEAQFMMLTVLEDHDLIFRSWRLALPGICSRKPPRRGCWKRFTSSLPAAPPCPVSERKIRSWSSRTVNIMNCASGNKGLNWRTHSMPARHIRQLDIHEDDVRTAARHDGQGLPSRSALGHAGKSWRGFEQAAQCFEVFPRIIHKDDSYRSPVHCWSQLWHDSFGKL